MIDSFNDAKEKYVTALNRIPYSQDYETVIQLLAGIKGKVIVTGIGKAGHIGQKFAATLCSNATTAVFMHAGEASHGDLGVVGGEDCLVAISTSGKSNEVIEAVQLTKQLVSIPIIGITSHPDSPLRKECDYIIDMGVVEEACPLGLTPTVSIAVMEFVCDFICIELMKLKGVSKADYAARHHGGYLGKKARVG